jgi:hypothetical protein
MFVVDKYGNVGVGTTTPIAKLDVWGNLNVGTSSTPTLFVNTATGNVGIGSASPISALAIGSGQITIPDGSVSAPSIALSSKTNTGIFGSTVGSNIQTTINGTSRLSVYGSGISVVGTVVVNGLGSAGTAAISQNSDSDTGIYWPAANQIAITASGSPAIFVDGANNGNVGIGTTSPLAKLDIQKSASGNIFALTSAASGDLLMVNNSGNLGLGGVDPGATTKLLVYGGGSDAEIKALGSGGKYISMIGGGGSYNQLVTSGGSLAITGGNVGIGTTTPAQTLSVAGNMRLTGALFDTNNASGTTGMLLSSTGNGTSWISTSSLGLLSGAITSLNGQTGSTQTFATSTSGGIDLFITSGSNIHTFTLNPSSGYSIPLTASTTEWSNFYATPSTRITAGTGLSWSGNTLNASNTFTGSGTTGKVAIWSSPTSLTSGLLIDNGTVAGVNATSSSYTFNIQGSSNVNPLNISSSSGASLLTVLGNGNVGVGTANPIATLDVGGAITQSYLSNFTAVANLSTNVNGLAGVQMANTNATGTNADFRFLITDTSTTTGNYIAFSMPGAGNTNTLFGQTRSNIATIFTNQNDA